MSPDPEGLSLTSLLAWLRAKVPAFDASGQCTAELLAGGRSNLTYTVTDASGSRWAIRRPPLGHLLPSAHDLGREHTVLRALDQAGFPVPRPWALCEDPSVLGARFLVMDFVDGLVIADSAGAARLAPSQAVSASQLLVDGLARLHALDTGAIGLGDFGRPEGYLARQVRRWGQQWQLTKTRELAGIDLMSAWLADRVTSLPVGLPWALVHGDYRMDNVIIDRDFSSLRAVLDWEMSTLGDPVADLAVALVYWTQADDLLRREVPVARDVTSGPGFWGREKIVEHYANLTGLDLGHLGFCLVLACYKLAVIMESLNFRGISGQQLGAAKERGEDMDGAVLALARLGVNLIEAPSVSTLQS
jgi:aminoglycoside phosphotransferase (APT) family kinase protein